MIPRNISDAPLQYIKKIMGYEIYVPQSSYNPLSFNKAGCPIWIKINTEGDCHVIYQKKDGNFDTEVTNYIIENLQKIEKT